MDFGASPSVPTRKEFEALHRDRTNSTDNASPTTFIPVGASAYTEGSTYTTLYFKCHAQGGDGETQFVRASMISPQRLKGNSQIKDRVTILNSVSRRLAEELGCAADASLPATVPDPEPT
ncbi:hypothetical protein [Streptomyces sp. NPDC048361]|uniref:hypothetical protein n=1 Tax=Streptomyces sp. NPDC048361 TaxID=3154720 RepID=UPI0034372022